MHFILTGLVLLGPLATAVTGQFPEACACPDDCVCKLETGIISCDDQGLRHIPIELNSCSWPGIHTVNLSSNFIREIQEYSFSLLTNLTRLYIYDNSIALVDRDAFVGLRSLEFLFLDGNRIPSLPYQVFRPLRNLKKLLLYDNELSTLPFGIFSQQSELTTLALYSNRLTELKTEWFDDTPYLEKLYLHDNRISDLSIAPFRSLHFLEVLFLGNNLLTQLTGPDFLGLRRLTMLVLSNNQIATIHNDVFLSTPQLQQLYLESNQLTEVNRLMFAPPVYLEQLRIYSNRISRISDGAFYRLRYLKLLSLNDNQISSITPQTFVGLDSLEELVIHNNHITSLRNNTFVQSPLLQKLWLNSNRISCLESDVFNNLGRLYLLNLGYNQLTHIPDGVFQSTPVLLYLLLNSNRLSTITNKPFANLPRLVQLALTSNPIEYLADGSISGSNSIYYFQFSYDRDVSVFRCDCSTLWLHEWMNSRPLLSSVKCGSPPQFAGLDIRTLQTASFGCESAVLTVEAGPDCDNHVVARGSCLQLTCSSRPRGTLTWSRADGRPIRMLPPSCSPSSSSCSQSVSGDGTLVLDSVTEEDSGYYICSASFRNQTAIQICHVTVSEPPVMRQIPEEVYLSYPGPSARFSLNFTGSPWPIVSWYHVLPSNGAEVKVTETGPQSKYLISDQGTLVILQTQFEDRGTYKAVVANGAGEVVTETRLYFFFESPCRSRCLNGGQCLEVSYCSCPDSYEGRHCENFVGVTEASTEEPPRPTTDAGVPFPTETTVQTTEAPPSNTKPPEATTETPTGNYNPDNVVVYESGSGSGENFDSGSTYLGSGDVELESGSGSGEETVFDDYGESLVDDEDYDNWFVNGAKRRRRKRSLFPSTPRKHRSHRIGRPGSDGLAVSSVQEPAREEAGAFVPRSNDQHDPSRPVSDFVDHYDNRASVLKFER